MSQHTSTPHSATGAHLTLVDSPRQSRSPGRLRLPAFLGGQRVLLCFVGLVVVMVSLPLLQSVALKENEVDAIRTLKLLGHALQAPEVQGAQGSGTQQKAQSPSPQQLSALFARDPDLARRLPDSELFDGGRVLMHHGYLIELMSGQDGTPRLRAWPVAHGDTGLGAFLWQGPGRILGHPNNKATWSGPGNGPAWPALEENSWRPIRLSTSRRSSGS